MKIRTELACNDLTTAPRRGKNGGEIIEGVDPVLNSLVHASRQKNGSDVSMTKVLIGADL